MTLPLARPWENKNAYRSEDADDHSSARNSRISRTRWRCDKTCIYTHHEKENRCILPSLRCAGIWPATVYAGAGGTPAELRLQCCDHRRTHRCRRAATNSAEVQQCTLSWDSVRTGFYDYVRAPHHSNGWGRGFRRMKAGGANTHIGGATIPCHYLSAREMRPASWRGIGVIVAPSWMECAFQDPHHSSTC